jgi:YD repeat-containing protein
VFGPTTDATLTYNAAHKPLAVMHGASSVATFTYDSGGRLTEVQGPSITRAFAYNGLGQLVTTATGSQRTMFAYDAVGRLVSLDNPTGTTISLAYLPGPVATTGAAKSVTHTTVTLTGTVNPAGAPTSYDFVFGTTRKYGRTTAAAAAGSGSPVTVSTSLTHLKPGTTYHYALVASNRNGTSTGSDHTFRTPSFSCHVPSLIGDTLRQARKALADHHCRLGHVSRPRHTKRRAHLTVSSQHPRAGAVKPAGTRVAVKLSAA